MAAAAAAAGGAPAGGGAGGAIAAALAGVVAGDVPAANRMAGLQAAQRQLRQPKKANASALKNELKRTKRLKEKAKNLSTADLQDILIQRAVAKAKAKPKAAPKAAPAAALAGGD